jgi:Pyruvate/2-oxoacid:ferredoxin oxidoreductase delta subunit
VPDTIWSYEQKEKSLDIISRDFFASGTKTLVLTPMQDKEMNKDFYNFISLILNHLTRIGQKVTIIGAGFWDSFNQVSKVNGMFVFETMPSFKAKRKDFLGRFSILDEAPPLLEKVGLLNDLCDCDNVVVIGNVRNSSRFGITALLSLVENILPTFTLTQSYMLNQNGLMQKALGEIIFAKLYPKVALSIVWNENGVVFGRDMVAVESVSINTTGLNIRNDKLLLESARLDIGDIFFSSSSIEGQFSGVKPVKSTRFNVKPRWLMQKCNLCLNCIDVCPNGSIYKKADHLAINSNCVRCGACIDECNMDALY